MSNARLVAFNALLRVNNDNGYSNIILDKALCDSDLDNRDAALAASIFYGVIERRLTLDYIISKYSNVPRNKVLCETMELLRIGIYQIMFMDKIPDSAAVNECVKIAKKKKLFSSVGFINGILRNVSRNKDKIVFPDKKDRVEYLKIKYSCPEWIINLWDNNYGEACTENILKSVMGRPGLTARVNNTHNSVEELILKLEESGVHAKSIDWIDNAIELENTGTISKLKSFNNGDFHIQDLASQFCCSVLSPRQGDLVLDVCSAPGGKTFTIAERMNNTGRVLSFDIYESKVSLIRGGSKRLGLSIIEANMRDAATSDFDLPMADRVLCDVPCSGLGIIRRKPEIRYKEVSTLKELYNIQYEILLNSSRFTKVGGILVYSTCTLNPLENNLVANRFLEENDNYVAYDINLPKNITRIYSEDRDNQITLMPHEHKTDGFFIAAFKRLR